MPTIILDATRSALGGVYYSSWEVVTAIDIPSEIFVYESAGDAFSHVAVAEEMLSVGVDPQAADFYRRGSASVTHDNISQATALIGIVKGKTDKLVEDFEKVIIDFIGSETSSHTF